MITQKCNIEKYSDETNNIYLIDHYLDEIEKIYININSRKDFLVWLDAKLTILDNSIIPIPGGSGNIFEKLKNCNDNLYSIRKKGIKNTRVIYSWHRSRKVILLVAFVEKNKSDYIKAIEKATNRLNSLKDNGYIKELFTL